MYHALERAVLAHDPQSNGERVIARAEAETLLASGLYRESSGAPFNAAHYRRSLEDGSCLHLVFEEARCRLHHDDHDPHSSVVGLSLHLNREARSEAVSWCAMALSVVRLLAR